MITRQLCWPSRMPALQVTWLSVCVQDPTLLVTIKPVMPLIWVLSTVSWVMSPPAFFTSIVYVNDEPDATGLLDGVIVTAKGESSAWAGLDIAASRPPTT